MTTEDTNVAAIDALDILATAMRGKTPIIQTIETGKKSASPDEGIALLSAYLAIEDRDTRQAVLDVVLSIGGRKS